MGKTIIVSNRLPVTIQKKEKDFVYSKSVGGLATGLDSIYRQENNLWIGWPGIYLKKSNAENEKIISKLKNENMAPVFLSKENVEEFYEGFSNATVWPLFHHFPTYANFEESHWQSYQNVNEIFCHEVLKHAEKDDTIWIHDYHLLLLPSLLRKHLPNARIAFFQHIPFPSFETFRILPWREEILKGLLGADLIGFHTYDDVRHFLSSLQRTLGLDNKMGEIRSEGRVLYADAFPMGIDYKKFEDAAKSEEVEKEMKRYFKGIDNIKSILSIDRLDYSKGIPERLKAYELFLSQFPEYVEKVSLIMVVVPSRENVELYKKLKIEIDELVGRINSKYRTIDWTPIIYFYRSFNFKSIVAFYKFSDIALVTPLRDGMNLVCKEYLASRTDKTGVIILSEMAGASKELSEAIMVNPNNIKNIVDGLKKALEMPREEQVMRNEEMQDILRRYDIYNWVKVFIKRLDDINRKQKEISLKSMSPELYKEILNSYESSGERILFLDYDGTLVSLKDKPQDATPDEELYKILSDLIKIKNTKVVIISGRDKITINKWLGHLPIDLVAEHGAWMRTNNEWTACAPLTQEWRTHIFPILNFFVERTPGSFIEEKDFSLGWHYRKADGGLGELRARELVDHLQYITGNMQMNIIEGKKVVEVKSSSVNKGRAVLNWLDKKYDFILAAGDDWTDEDMFKEMPQNAYTIKVGASPSIAKYNISSCDDEPCIGMRKLLKSFC